jgi:hypothetical protein
MGICFRRDPNISRNTATNTEHFPRHIGRKQRTNYECSVKVFNSSVEIHVEKARAMIEIDSLNRDLLLFAQVCVQTFKLCGLDCDDSK